MCSLKLFILVIVFSDLQFLGNSKELPSTFKLCRRKDPKLNPCLKEAIQISLRELRNGIPNLQVLPVDPLYIDDVIINAGTKAVNLNQHYTKPKITGISDMTVVKVEGILDDTNLNFTTVLKAKKLGMYSKYEFDGKLTALTINGHGNFEWEVFNVTLYLNLVGSTYQKKNKTYMMLTSAKMHFVPEKARFLMENLFGNPVLSKEINRVINENWYDVENELQPAIEEVLDKIILQIGNTIIAKVPYDQLALLS